MEYVWNIVTNFWGVLSMMAATALAIMELSAALEPVTTEALSLEDESPL